MTEWQPLLLGLVAAGVLAFATWLLSLPLRNVSIVDSAWSLLVSACGVVYLLTAAMPGPRAGLLLLLLVAWTLRLCLYITFRNWGHGEDRRYQAIRARNEPGFAFKSLYLVFGLQAVLAWVVALPLYAGFTSARAINALDYLGLAVWSFGFFFETIGDWQLSRFKSDPRNQGQVMNRGLWRYTRHPNYFGEWCVWLGFFLLALAAGGWWTLLSPLLMSVLLMKVSGVGLLEKDIGERRPGYRHYIARTNAFFPWLPRALSLCLLFVLGGCSSMPATELATVPKVELQRFMGPWYVIASIPTFIEREAFNAVESYALESDGTIATTFTFNKGASTGPLKTYTPRGFVLDTNSNARWGMRFVWPIKADYRIVFLDGAYTMTIIGRQARDYVWIMARTPSISAADYARLVQMVKDIGYDSSKLRKVPQQEPQR